MTKQKLNTFILEEINKRCKDDKTMYEFLNDIINFEINSSRRTHYRSEISKKVKKYTAEWEGGDNDEVKGVNS